MIKIILTDVDGVLTDAGMYYDCHGNELKKFSTYDGVAVRLAHEYHMKVGIITGENTKIVKARAKKLNIDFLYMGVDDKLKVVKEICNKNNVSLDEIAYIGDDINDKMVLKAVGVTGCPSSAYSNFIKSLADVITKRKGGEGAFREFVEYIINHK